MSGDILDKTSSISPHEQITKFNDFMGTFPHPYKIVVAGNHDAYFQFLGREKVSKLLSNCIYLENTETVIRVRMESDGVVGQQECGGSDGVRHIKFFGSPASVFANSPNSAFQYKKESEELKNLWEKIPEDTDILVTHGPPKNYGDQDGTGDGLLLDKIKEVKPKYHIFGHNHLQHGAYQIFHSNYSSNDLFFKSTNTITTTTTKPSMMTKKKLKAMIEEGSNSKPKPSKTFFINAASLGMFYLPYHPAIVFDMDLCAHN
jgi:predicted phosphohydrolase